MSQWKHHQEIKSKAIHYENKKVLDKIQNPTEKEYLKSIFENNQIK